MLDFDGLELPEETQKALSEKFESALAERVESEVSGLKGKVDELLNEKKSMQQKAEEEKQAALKAAEEAARKSGDVEAIDKSWNEKYSKLESEYGEQLSQKDKLIRDLTVGSTATKLAAELGKDNADGLMPHILPRLDVDPATGTVKVLDTQGKPSALSVEELKDELRNTAYLAPLIVASQAAGGGSNGNNSVSGANGQNLTAEQQRAAAINKRLGLN